MLKNFGLGGYFLRRYYFCGIYTLGLDRNKYYTLKSFVDSKDDYNIWCMKGWSNTLEKMNYDCDICFFGNSLTYYSDYQKFFPSYKFVNLGYPGQGIKGMKRIKSVNPEKIFIMAGINDLRLDKMSFNEFSSYYSQLIDSIIASNPNSDVYIESVLPVNHSIDTKHPQTYNIEEANSFIKELAKEKQLHYIDLYTSYADKNGELKKEYTDDGIHLKSEGYKVWANIISKYIQK